jgi:hypothetical protein
MQALYLLVTPEIVVVPMLDVVVPVVVVPVVVVPVVVVPAVGEPVSRASSISFSNAATFDRKTL